MRQPATDAGRRLVALHPWADEIAVAIEREARDQALEALETVVLTGLPSFYYRHQTDATTLEPLLKQKVVLAAISELRRG